MRSNPTQPTITMLSTFAALAILAASPAMAISDQFAPLRSNGNSPFCLDVVGAAIPGPGAPVDVGL